MLTKKLLVKILAIVLVISVLGSAFITKTVNAEDWVEVYTASEFNDIRLDPSLNYRLMNHIDLAGYPNWVPIGTDLSAFTGKLDGNGKVISGLKITDTTGTSQGLFGRIGSTAWITDLSIQDAAITAGSYTGILAGKNAGNVVGCDVSGSISGVDYVGGLVGQNSGTINQSFSTATVTGRGYVGGLAGSNSLTISESYAASPILASVFNNYIEFDGNDDYIEIPHIGAYQTASFTLEAWFQWDPAFIDNGDINNDADVQFIVGKGYEQFEIHTEGGSGQNGIRFIPLPRTTIVGESFDAYHDVLDVIQPGWFHVASSWDFNTKTVRVYVNGVQQEIFHWNEGMTARISAGLEASVDLKNPDTNPFESNIFPLLIGARSNSSLGGPPDSFFKGKIADVRFWNTVRSGEEIDADKNKQLTGTESGLMGYWKLNEDVGAGDTAVDSSINGNHGTLMNGAARVQESITNVGGLVGEDLSINGISGSYYDSEASGMSDSGKGEGKTTAEMKTLATFSGWDFVNTWTMTEDVTYPSFLRYTLNYAAGANGSLSGNISQPVSPDGFGSAVTAVADSGYHFVRWSDDSTANPRTDVAVGADLSVTASFAPNQITVNFNAEGGAVSPSSQTKLFDATYGVGVDGSTPDLLPVPSRENHRFDGWYDGAGGTGNLLTDASTVSNAAAHTLYAKWVRQYTLSYTAGANGSLSGSASQVVDAGGNGSAVTAVADNGYHFVRWSDDVLTATRTDLNISGDLIVTASFAPNQITVNFDAEGGAVSPSSQTKLFDATYGVGADGSTPESLPIPTLANHRFDGWYDGDNGTGNLVTDASTVSNTGTHTLYAKWVRQHTLSYTAGANGSLSGSANQVVDAGGNGSAVTAVADSGYHFVKWSDDSTANPRTDVAVGADLSVTASFAPNQITVNFDAEGGAVSPSSQTKLFDATYGVGADGSTPDLLPVPSRENHRFDGWYDGTGGNGNLVTDASTVSNPATHTLYAKWVRQYTLSYTAGANGSLSGSASQVVDTGSDGSAVTAVADSGYHFVRWSDDSTANPRTDVAVGADLNVTASFAPNQITVNFDAEGGAVSPSSQTKLFNATYGVGADGSTPESLPIPTLANHRFDGWYDGDNGTGNLVTDANTVSNPATHTLYAKWVRQYTLSYTAGANGSLSGSASQVVDAGGNGSAVTAVADSGYHFVRWSDDVLTATRTDLNISGDLIVTAIFEKTIYTSYLPLVFGSRP